MPKVFTDDESSESEVADRITVKSPGPKETEASGRMRRRNAAPAKAVEQVDDDEEESDEELDDDVFIVETIKKHMIDEQGLLKFQVKWEGWDDKKDLTWEPEENLEESAQSVLDEYFAKIGGRENIFKQTKSAIQKKKRGRPSAGTNGAAPAKRPRTSIPHPRDSTPPETNRWNPPIGSWEEEVKSVCDVNFDEKTRKLIIYLEWHRGTKTKHASEVVYKKCPQKMLQFYERHITIRPAEEDEAKDED